MTLKLSCIIGLLALLIGSGSGYGVRSYMAHKDELAAQNEALRKADQAKQDYIDKLAKRDKQNQELQDKLTRLDTQHTQALDEQLRKNDDLRHDLAVSQRMRLTGASCVSGPATGDQTPSTGSMGHATTVELSPATRQAVFDLRASIIQDQERLRYLQDYIRRLKLSPPEPEEAPP